MSSTLSTDENSAIHSGGGMPTCIPEEGTSVTLTKLKMMKLQRDAIRNKIQCFRTGTSADEQLAFAMLYNANGDVRQALNMFEMAIDAIQRQTNYTKEEAIQHWNLHSGDVKTTVLEYFRAQQPKKTKEEEEEAALLQPTLNPNQAIFREMRNFFTITDAKKKQAEAKDLLC